MPAPDTRKGARADKEVRKEDKMLTKLTGVLGLAALLTALATPAVAQETEWVWKTDGKRWTRSEQPVKPFVMPTTTTIEVAAGEQKEGDILGFKYTGKRMERVYFREVPRTEVAHKGHECTWRMVYERKAVNRFHYCLVNGAEKPCPGMTEAGECLAKY